MMDGAKLAKHAQGSFGTVFIPSFYFSFGQKTGIMKYSHDASYHFISLFFSGGDELIDNSSPSLLNTRTRCTSTYLPTEEEKSIF